MSQKKIRNVAIIAHVDHGKTTLVDQLLQESDSLERNQAFNTRLMDSNDLEKERGITILSKCTTINWNDYTFNVVDTPGHADFGGEVERILSMVDGVLILVDAAEGAMPQTKFVLTKALAQNLRPIVVINKMDRSDERHEEVLEEMFDLFINLNASEEQLDFPILYASAKNGWAIKNLSDAKENMDSVFKAIVDHVPVPNGSPTNDFQMLVTTLDADPYLGRILMGRIYNGTAKINMPVHAINREGEIIDQGRITKIFVSKGLAPVPIEEASTGSIVSIAGLSVATVSDTITALSCTEKIPSIAIDPPTIAMNFAINDSPLVGREGNQLTSRMLWDRLLKEVETNVSIQVSESQAGEGYEVAARGELQLSVLIETMRREGFELSIGRPRVVFKNDENGKRLEPIEDVKIDVEEEFVGVIVEAMSKRKGELTNMQPLDGNRTRITLRCPSRGLIGFRNELLTSTRGTGVMHHSFDGYEPYRGDIPSQRNGVLISSGQGKAVAYSLLSLEERGFLFIEPGEDLYEGMIIGEHSRANDLVVNPLKGKKLSNMRSAGKDKEVKLAPPIRMTLEQALSYIKDDELVEVTPENIRLRKKYLTENERKRMGGKA